MEREFRLSLPGSGRRGFHRARTAGLFLAVAIVGLGPGRALAGEVTESFERVRLGPGEVTVYWLQRSGPAIRLFVDHDRHPGHRLTADAALALARAPAWVRPALFDQLGRLPDAVQDRLAGAILDAADEDPRFVDEVAFSVARIAPEELDPEEGDPFDPELLLENARGIYGADPLLDYVELVEVGDPAVDDDFHTFTRYRLRRDGVEVTWDLPAEDYYWWVVHPMVSNNRVAYVEPRRGDPAPRDEGGFLWRTYLMDPAPSPDYAREFSLRVPDPVTDAELEGWGPSARGWLEALSTDPIVVAVRAADGRPVWLRYTFRASGAGGSGNGTVIATTLRVEAAYEAGQSDLLVNLACQGDGEVRILPGQPGNRILLVKDRDPFGQASVEEVLGAEGYAYEVWDSSSFAALGTWEELEGLGFEKIIVPSDQPRVLYERLSGVREVVNGWLGRSAGSDDMVFELHGAPGPAGEEWSDLELPGGLRGHDLTDDTDQVEVRGYPRPLEVLADTALAWDGQHHPGLDGERRLDPDSFALDKLGYVVSQNLDDNLSELPADFAGPDGDAPGPAHLRSVEPARLIYGHYGNCGENADLWVAIGRVGLLPLNNTGSPAEDHVWAEVLLDGAWRSVQTDWSDGATRIDHPANGYDKQHGGGKDLSMVFGTRGDGLLVNVTPRYTDTVTFRVRVTDAAGRPADGARILVANESYYDADALTLAMVEFAGADGVAEFPAGEHQNYYFQVTHSAAGAWPDADHVSLVACAEPLAVTAGGQTCPDGTLTTDATGEVLELDIQLDQSLFELPVSPADASDLALSDDRLIIDLALTAQVLYGTVGGATHSRWQPGSEADVDAYLVDLENLLRYQEGRSFEAWRQWPGTTTSQWELNLPATATDWFLLVSNARRGATAVHLDLSLTLVTPDPMPSLNPGCNCHAARDARDLGPLLLFGVLFFLCRRRRR